MSSGAKALAVGLWLGLYAALPARADTGFDTDALMTQLRRVAASHAHFTEQRFTSVLTEPIESAGTLAYVAPDYLEKNTDKPAVEHVTVRGDQVTMEQANTPPRSFALSESPEISALIESIRATLSGDRAALERYYALSVQGSAEDWTLRLTPKPGRIRKLVDEIRISGTAQSVRSVETLEHGGDRSVMTITEDKP